MLDFPVLTDIHEPSQAASCRGIRRHFADSGIPMPADGSAGRGGGVPARSFNIKKGQFVSPHDIRHAADKVASTGNNQILLTERGATFGYNNLVVDMRGYSDHEKFRMACLCSMRRIACSYQEHREMRREVSRSFIEPLASAASRRGGRTRCSWKSTRPRSALYPMERTLLRLDLLGPLWKKLLRINAAVVDHPDRASRICLSCCF